MHDAALTEQIIGCAMRVHRTLGPGFLESVYAKALAHELSKAGLQVECQRAAKVVYDGIGGDDFVADMLIARIVPKAKQPGSHEVFFNPVNPVNPV